MDATPPSPWSWWLTKQLNAANWTPAELSRQSGRRGPDDPRPVIATDVISRWMTGKTRRPDYETVLLVARLLSAPREAALAAAGYELLGDEDVAATNSRPEGEIDRVSVAAPGDADYVTEGGVPGEDEPELLQEIADAARRLADLTERLLTRDRRS